MRTIYLGLISLVFVIWGFNQALGQDMIVTDFHASTQIVKAEVLAIDQADRNYLLTVMILNGFYQGTIIKLPYLQESATGNLIKIELHDKVLVQLEVNNENITKAYISDLVRDRQLFYLALIFILILILIGGKKGVKSLVSLVISGGAIFFVMLPLIFHGYNPIAITILISTAVSIFTLFVFAGINSKTIAAIVGTTGGVLMAGTLAVTIGSTAQLTGLGDEEMHFLLSLSQKTNYDYHGILFSGMIIGALGAVMDVGMSIASTIEEIKLANPSLGTFDLMGAGMKVGRDTLGTMANTLIFAYTGGAIPLMLIFMAYHTPLIKIINLDLIATEVIRALTGSIGLIIAVPVTSLVAGFLFNRFDHKEKIS